MGSRQRGAGIELRAQSERAIRLRTGTGAVGGVRRLGLSVALNDGGRSFGRETPQRGAAQDTPLQTLSVVDSP